MTPLVRDFVQGGQKGEVEAEGMAGIRERGPKSRGRDRRQGWWWVGRLKGCACGPHLAQTMAAGARRGACCPFPGLAGCFLGQYFGQPWPFLAECYC